MGYSTRMASFGATGGSDTTAATKNDDPGDPRLATFLESNRRARARLAAGRRREEGKQAKLRTELGHATFDAWRREQEAEAAAAGASAAASAVAATATTTSAPRPDISCLDVSKVHPGEGPEGTPSERRCAATLRTACTTDGFFYLVGHGIPDALLARVFERSAHFFSGLTLAQKMTALAVKSRGYTPMAEETLDPSRQSRGDTKEGYYIGNQEKAEEEEDGQGDKESTAAADDDTDAIGPNVWPDESALPGMAGWKATMQEYFAAVHALGMRMLRLLALSLDLRADFFDNKFSAPMEALRLLHYSAETSSTAQGVYGCGAHSDYGMLTFLLTDAVPGLEILRSARGAREEDEDWFPVAPRPGAFIVNLGDMLQRWTNDVYSSTVHRVVNRTGRERYSIPFFFEPNFDTVVDCLPQFVTAERPARYAKTTSGEHLLSKYAETHANFSVEGKSSTVEFS